ncbi:MAG: hypothetical protein A2534_03350 [Candidatus Magasanikbacteria bacterium RIFOXYD2_FULL_39_9]|uniref:Uncharacterized protein n=1 Tax=Candidatus Magasanikbacteria bacterium RIFOXYD1_FULL_40_23 TaxID=1798705 RepID=A0A1F6PB00_9BACT|nr:MAG: hypothetical protein A2534_03350 [Candidatus Magasanikbacteria bacterium RIFOXYD2_FULL_39_9]OGH93124.1 MAG: hypothetical protein A2563_00355 [Candidatus Magasanikbacteria bacterium RIFOXYD1_FULL_40_23]
MFTSNEEKQLVGSWEEAGVLREINPETLPLASKALVFSCFDERYVSQWLDVINKNAAQKQERALPALFPVICAGGPLVVAPSSPIHETCDHRGMVNLNVETATVNGCRHATLIGHYPCLGGQKFGIDLIHNVALLVVAKRWLNTMGIDAAIIFDVKEQETDPCHPRHLKANEFETWCQKFRPDILVKHPGIVRRAA